MKRCYVWAGLAAMLASGAPTASAQTYSATADAGIFYVYDPVGRLVGVVTPTGDVAQYMYDPAGNITQINRYDGGIQVLGFGPNGAAPGSTITIYGSGFSGGDTVTIGGQTATVDSATGTQLVVTVPTGAAGGTVSVSGGGSSSDSAWGLTVPDSGISISSFAPDAGDAGTQFTIYGSGFDPNPVNDVVLVNTTEVAIVDAGPTTLVVTVPFAATSGHVSVTDTIGTATACGDFYIPPPGYDVSAIVATARATVGGCAKTLSGITSPQIGLLLFDAQAGAALSVAVTSLTGGGSVTVLDPKGIESYSGYLSSVGAFPLPPLLATGTYELVVSGDITTVSLQLVADAAGPSDGGLFTFNPSVTGQSGMLQFEGTAGENLTLSASSSTFSFPLVASVYEPGGVLLGSGYLYPIFKVPTILVTGPHIAILTPYNGTDTGEANVQLLQDVEGTITAGGCPVGVSLVAGQYGHYTFDGTSAQLLGLGVPGFSTDPASGVVFFEVDSPPEPSISSYLTTATLSSAGHAELPVLPATGTYDIWVEPQALFYFDGGIQLVEPQTGSLTVATPVTFSTSLVGQQGIYTFSGTSGQNLSIGLTSVTFPDYIVATVYDPSGAVYTAADVYNPTDATLDLAGLTLSGTYTLVLEAYAADTGEVTMELFEDATGVVTTDGGLTAVSLGAGQRGDYTFAGDEGEYLGLGVTDLSTSPSGVQISFTVYEPSGATLATDYTYASTASFALPELPATGTYTIHVEPFWDAAPTASMYLDLLPADTGSLTSGSPVTFDAGEAGQDGVYTFTATTGQNFSLVGTDSTFSSYVSVTVVAPDGTTVVGTGDLYSAYAMVIDLQSLPQTGTYTVTVDPAEGTGTLSLELIQDASATLATDGTALSVSLSAGQRGDYTFTGDAGDFLGGGVTSFSTSPGSSTAVGYVYEPDGNILTDFVISADLSFTIPQLPVSGTYTIRIEPWLTTAATCTLDLAEPVTGTLTSGGSPETFSTSAVGQEGVYTFSGTSGDNDTLYVSSFSFTDVVYVTVYDPSFNQVDIEAFYACGSLTLPTLATTGTFTVLVSPYQVGTGSLALQLN